MTVPGESTFFVLRGEMCSRATRNSVETFNPVDEGTYTLRVTDTKPRAYIIIKGTVVILSGLGLYSSHAGWFIIF